VFDKVEENTRGLSASGRMTYGETVNLSMNQVLMRSLNTSLVAIMPILSILLIGAYALGATTLEDFGLALLVGLLTGAYSSIFIASPILALLKEREPRYASIRQRVLAKGGSSAPLTPAAAAAMSAGGGGGGGGGGSRRGVMRPAASVATGDDEVDDVDGGGARQPVPAANRGRTVPVNRPRQGGRPGSRPKPRKKGKRR
jgi:preprotein translocase subunit SecF